MLCHLPNMINHCEFNFTCYRTSSKCTFDVPRIEFLGMIIGQGRIEMDSVKLSAIKEWKPPTSVKGIRSFLGFANFYRKFIPNFSNVVAPLNLLTRKDQPWAWTNLQQRAFDTLKAAFSSGPVLSIPDVTRPFSIMTDVTLDSGRGKRRLLSQRG